MYRGSSRATILALRSTCGSSLYRFHALRRKGNFRNFAFHDFCELRRDGVLRSSQQISQGVIIQVSVEPLRKPGEKEEILCHSHTSTARSCSTSRSAREPLPDDAWWLGLRPHLAAPLVRSAL